MIMVPMIYKKQTWEQLFNHFDFECKEGGKTLSFKVSNPGIAMPGDNYEYIASFEF